MYQLQNVNEGQKPEESFKIYSLQLELFLDLI